MEDIRRGIVGWFVHKKIETKVEGFVVGVSGGIDSAVASALCAHTGFKTMVVTLPIDIGNHTYKSARRSLNHIKWLHSRHPNIRHMNINLDSTYHALRQAIPSVATRVNWLAMANMQARLRMTALYTVANHNNLLVCGTGNKIEDFGIGFFTKHGDGAVDISPLADLMKSEVYKLADCLGIRKEIREAIPSDDLWANGRSDVDQIGATYPELEWAMNYRDAEEWGVQQDAPNERQTEVLAIYDELHAKNYHKMMMPPKYEIRRI